MSKNVIIRGVERAYMRIHNKSPEQVRYRLILQATMAGLIFGLFIFLSVLGIIKPLYAVVIGLLLVALSFLPVAITVVKDERRTHAIEAALVPVLYSVATTMSATGMGIRAAFGEALKTAKEPLKSELLQTYRSMEAAKKPFSDALAEMANRNDSVFLTHTCNVISSAYAQYGERGLNLALKASADMIRDSHIIESERKSAIKTPTVITFVLSAALLPFVVGIVVTFAASKIPVIQQLGPHASIFITDPKTIQLATLVVPIYALTQAIVTSYGCGRIIEKSWLKFGLYSLISIGVWTLVHWLFFGQYLAV